MKYPSGSTLHGDKAFNELWWDIIKQELHRCGCMELNNYHFSFWHTNDREKIENQITPLLEVYNPGEISIMLFTDEKTLYQIAYKLGFYEFVVSQDTFYSNIQTPYCINDMYSMGYLIN